MSRSVRFMIGDKQQQQQQQQQNSMKLMASLAKDRAEVKAGFVAKTDQYSWIYLKEIPILVCAYYFCVVSDVHVLYKYFHYI